jgi:hypothetical protein
MINVFIGMMLAILTSSIIFFLLWWFDIFEMLSAKKRIYHMVKTLRDIHKEHVKEKKKNDKQRDSKHSNKKDAVKT